MESLILGMWSGPRNISTAMMRAWENRSDCVVWDEPLYAHYLQHTGIDHPLANEIIQAGETDWKKVVKEICTPKKGKVFYQKHISTHMLPHITLDWLQHSEHIFLIRDPQFMVASYAAKREQITAADLGYEELQSVFNAVLKLKNETPLVIDSSTFLKQPKQQLQSVCKHLNIPFEEQMLAWPAGERASDGVWHSHWYDSVKKSTHFQAPREQTATLDAAQQSVVDQCQPHYENLKQYALQN